MLGLYLYKPHCNYTYSLNNLFSTKKQISEMQNFYFTCMFVLNIMQLFELKTLHN